MRISNNTRETIDLIVEGKPKDGVPPTKHIAPGATEDLNVVEDARFQGLVLAGAISVPARVADKVESVVAAPPTPAPKGK